MIEKALKYIVGLKNPDIRELGGQTYSDKQLYRINHNPKAEPIELTTLSSLVEYISSEYDKRGKIFIHVVDPTTVKVLSVLDEDRVREQMVEVKAQIPHFNFNNFIDHEAFCINLQSVFAPNDDRALLLKFAGTIEKGTLAQYGDDGVTQKATIKTGIASKGDAIVPNPVALKAYRTFVEVEQPETSYIFRMKEGFDGKIMCGLFEADGGAWKIEAMQDIKKYLEDELISAYTNDIVILS